jgi:hypothetical protein
MKAATETLDRTVVKRPLNKQNLCLDKGYDYPGIYQKKIRATYPSQRCGERIDRVCNEEMGCRKNQFVAQQIQKVISKI